MNRIIIFNKNNKQTTIEVEYANTFLKRLTGLVNKEEFTGLLFKQKHHNRFQGSIHTCFMKKTIDIIYISTSGQIQETKTLKPWKLYVPKKNNIKYIIELPEKSIKKYGLKINSKACII